MAAERWWHSVAIGLLHLILFGFAFGIGFVLEVFVSRYYQGSHLAAFYPCIAASAFLMGLLVNRTRKDRNPPSLRNRGRSLACLCHLGRRSLVGVQLVPRIEDPISDPYVLRHSTTMQRERVHRRTVLHDPLRRRHRLLRRSRCRPDDSCLAPWPQTESKHALILGTKGVSTPLLLRRINGFRGGSTPSVLTIQLIPSLS